MEALFISTGIVALAEIGDKTQLLAFLLAARFKKPLPIIAGILCATVVNHGLAGALGAWITASLSPEILRWVLGASFIGMAVWTLIPDKIEDDEGDIAGRWGVFGATLITFFLAEMGDKTQIATVAMAAHFPDPVLVVVGTTLFISTGIVALAEIGDKTQLLAFLLAARFKKPLPIIAGILCATVVNHGLAGALGAWITASLSPEILRWVLGASFIGMAVWTLIPDKIEDDEGDIAGRWGVFGATLITFFLAEMGDKTQIATVAMAAHFPDPVLVVVGTTLGMLIADAPAVFIGDRLSARIPMRLVHGIAAALFAVLGAATLLGAGADWGF